MLELEVVRVEEEASVERKGRSVPLYKGREYRTPPPKPKNLPIPKESFPQDDRVTHARIDENPAIRGHDLCVDKMCQW